MYDVIVIGGGICGASVLFELSKLKIKAALVEKESDISMGTTKANSAIVHAGYDPMPGTLMAKYNVKGSKLINKLCEDLNVPYKQIGSLVLAFNDDEMEEVKTLYNRGKENGVDGLKIISEQEVIQLEPNINPVKGALLAETAAIVSPWSLAIALCETAVINGAKVFCNNEIEQIDFQNEIYTLKTNNNEFKTKYIINCAGLFADKIQEMAAKSKSYFQIKPDKGCYYLLDKSQGDIVKHIVFQCPTKVGKGVLVSPTTHGNLIVGPDSQRIVSNCDLSTKRENLEFVKLMAAKTTSKINYRENVRNFAGLRAYSNFNDFIVEKSPQNQNFINVAGIKSPGLSSAPAIAEDVINMLFEMGLNAHKKKEFINKREKIYFAELNTEEKQKIIEKNPKYGNVICRCNTVTEGEIIDALHSPIVPQTLDGIKRRCGSGMGRCQGGFCGPKIHEIIARELNIKMENIELEKNGSYLVTEKTNKGIEV